MRKKKNLRTPPDRNEHTCSRDTIKRIDGRARCRRCRASWHQKQRRKKLRNSGICSECGQCDTVVGRRRCSGCINKGKLWQRQRRKEIKNRGIPK